MIERIEVLAVGPDSTRHSWASNLPAQYATLNLVRVVDETGVEGVGASPAYSTGRFDLSVFESLRVIAPRALGSDPLLRTELWRSLQDMALPVLLTAHAALDIAVWDLAARRADVRLFELLGGARTRLPAYASTPLLEDPPAYVELVHQLVEQGFRAVKFHAWCEPERDLEMLRAVHEAHGDRGVRFMHDAEQRYDRGSALRVARELDAMGGFAWLEAPLPDLDIEGYAELRRRVGVPILPGGNTILDPLHLATALRDEPWDAVRFDVTVAGGVTPSRTLAALAEAAGVWAELQSWGYTLIQAANLHVGLATGAAGYFESPVPYDPYEFGVGNPIRIDGDGFVEAPPGHGLGIELDWERLRAATLASFTCSVDAPEPA
jgi:L-alanine-DL-glutamate epimerase-like enolase superfamily enzyme